MSRHRFEIVLADSSGVRLKQKVTAKNLGGALDRACHLAVKSGISEPGVSATVERRDA